MKIQIQFISADVENKGKYNMAEIAYKDIAKGQVGSKKLMSFNNPNVYKTLVDAKKGEIYDIEMQKNDKGYWDWIAVSITNSVSTTSAGVPDSGKSNQSPKSSYETAEERAQRQVMIVRQSSASTAVAALKTEKKTPTVAEVISFAKQLEDYVFGRDQQPVPLADLPPMDGDDDIPE